MQHAVTDSHLICRAPDERSLIQRRFFLFWLQHGRDAAERGSRQALHRRQQATKRLAGLQAASAIRQPGRPDLQGLLPHRLIRTHVPGLGHGLIKHIHEN